MSRRKKQTPHDFVRESLISKVSTLMNNRRKILAPFPIAAEEIYRRGWTLEERQALRLLAKRPEFLRVGRQVLVRLMLNDGEIVSVVAKLKAEVPMPTHSMFTVPEDNLPEEMLAAMRQWAPLWMELNAEQVELESKLKEIGRACRTFGQLYRLWPDLLSFYDQAGKEKVMQASAKSPYPDSVLMWQDNTIRVLRPEWQPHAFAPFTSMIAECLMLSTSEITEVATVIEY